jgi:hypothetical protein
LLHDHFESANLRSEFSGRIYELSSRGSTIWIGACGMVNQWLSAYHIQFSRGKSGQDLETWSWPFGPLLFRTQIISPARIITDPQWRVMRIIRVSQPADTLWIW